MVGTAAGLEGAQPDRDPAFRRLGIGGSSGQLIEKDIKGGNPAVPGNDEISPGVRGRLTRAARYPPDPPAIAQFLGLGNWLISKISVSCPDRARDAIDFVAATMCSAGRIVEHSVFGVDFVDSGAPTNGVVFTEDVMKIAGQQGGYAGGVHTVCPFCYFSGGMERQKSASSIKACHIVRTTLPKGRPSTR